MDNGVGTMARDLGWRSENIAAFSPRLNQDFCLWLSVLHSWSVVSQFEGRVGCYAFEVVMPASPWCPHAVSCRKLFKQAVVTFVPEER